MNPELFIDYLPWLRMPKKYYELKGWADEEIQYALMMRSLHTTPSPRGDNYSINHPSLDKLYKTGSLETLSLIGGTSFWKTPKKLEQGWGFADMSEVNIVIAPSGQIEAYNAHPIRGMPGATDCLGVLAQNLESYLAALFYAQFNKSHFISGFPDENPILYEKTVLVAKHCALIAGGYAFYDFWAGILGLPYSDTVPE